MSFGLLIFPGVWDWYLQWREQRRGFYTKWEEDMLTASLVRALQSLSPSQSPRLPLAKRIPGRQDAPALVHGINLMTVTVILGPEYDKTLRTTVMDVMGQLGASVESRIWSVAGSQEIETVQARLAGQQIIIEAESYIGLSITGDEDMINEISERVRQANQTTPT
ncbi:hypothetical protein ATY77_08320 [Rhizobium sp. R634]|nr:hypothetical protein ATY77_07070 [Rhizobium sp. R634]OWV73219.1 hypothetical protein ATY77_08320 [Rhizobium sp. R634]